MSCLGSFDLYGWSTTLPWIDQRSTANMVMASEVHSLAVCGGASSGELLQFLTSLWSLLTGWGRTRTHRQTFSYTCLQQSVYLLPCQFTASIAWLSLCTSGTLCPLKSHPTT